MKSYILIPFIGFLMISIGCNSSSVDVQPGAIQNVPEPTPETIPPEVGKIDPQFINVPVPQEIKVPGKLPEMSGPEAIANTDDLSVPEAPKYDGNLPEEIGAKRFKKEQINRKGAEASVQIQPLKIRPQIDILFVIDDSMSMAAHQRNLSRNINKFVKAFSRNNQLDYQIAVTSIYDTKRYFKQSDLPVDDERNLQGVTEISRLSPGKRNFYRLGQLVPIPGEKKGETVVTSKTPNEISQLKSLLKIGTKKFVKRDAFDRQNPEKLIIEAHGPRYEEILYPMVAALDVKQLVFGTNSKFFRQHYPKSKGWDPASQNWMGFSEAFNSKFPRKGAHLAVIFVTDTFDQSYRLSPEQTRDYLVALKGDPNFEKISTYGVLHPNSLSKRVKRNFRQRFRQNCNADEDVRGIKSLDRPELLESFLSFTRGDRKEGSNIFNICNSNYGTRLAQVGNEIRTKTLKRLEIPLDFIPERNRIRVTYAGIKILDSASNRNLRRPSPYFWKFRSFDKTIIIYNLDQFVAKGESNSVEIDFAIIDPNTATKENSRRIGQQPGSN